MSGIFRRGVRSITYLHTGSRVRGLKRDPAEALKNPEGLHYDSFKENELSQVRKALRLEENNIALPDGVILQCVTHKSFAQGIKPYNQKLAMLGSHFLKYQASVYSLKQQDASSSDPTVDSQNKINGLNFSNLGAQLSKSIISKDVVAKHIKEKQLDSLVFWNKRDIDRDHKYNGEYTVLQSVLNAFVGSIYLLNGAEKAGEYVNNELLGESKTSLVHIAKDYVKDSE